MAVSQRKVGAILSFAKLALSAVLSMVYVPLLLAFLTKEEYGVYELVGSIIAYLALADLGFLGALNRFFVHVRVKEGEEGVQNLLSMAAVVYGVLTVAAVGLSVGFDAALDSLMGSSFTAAELELAHDMMKLVTLNCVVMIPGNWYLAIVNANERFVFSNVAGIVRVMGNTLAAVLVLTWHAGAMGVLAVQVASNALFNVANVVYVRRVLKVRAKFRRWDFALLGSMFTFSAFSLTEAVFNLLYWKTGQLVLGAVCGSAAVAVYSVACKLVTQGFMAVANGVTGVFLPKLTAIAARTDAMDEINELFCRIGRIQGIVVWATVAGFVAVGEQFVELWAGPEFHEAYLCTLMFLVPLSLSLVQNLALSVLQAKNKMAFRCVVYLALAVVDVLACIPVARSFGVLGCAAVTAGLLLVGVGPVMNVYYHRVIGLDIPAFFRAVLPLIVPAAVSGLAARAFMALPFVGLSWGSFAGAVAVFLAVDAALLWRFFANDYEKGLVRPMLARLGLRRR